MKREAVANNRVNPPGGAGPSARRTAGPSVVGVCEGTARQRTFPLPKAILIDMDDTIFDHALTCKAALQALRIGQPSLQSRSLDAVWHEYSRLLEEVHPDVLAGVVSPDRARQERFRQLAAFCGATISPSRGGVLSRIYRSHYQSLRKPVPGARELLGRLHGRAVIGVVTNNQVAEQEEKLTYLGVRNLIDLLIVSEEVGASKPDARIYEIALERAAAKASEAVMLGDSWPNDVLGARSAGIRAVWFNRFGQPNPEPNAVAELTSLLDPRHVEYVLSNPGAFSEGPKR